MRRDDRMALVALVFLAIGLALGTVAPYVLNWAAS